MARIAVENVSVVFTIYDGAGRSLRNRLMSASTGGRIGSDEHRRLNVKALGDLSFVLERGDRVALIGHNGAGKTTLLRVLAGVYTPVQGIVQVQGRVAPLFDVGFGMDPDATGYENIRLRGLYLGLTREEVEERMDDIGSFTELGSFLDMPMRTYSAGMQARLAFAVSTSINPEILLLDEQIGAGDGAFMRKASKRLEDLIARSGILVLASHSNENVRRFCSKAILLEHGSLRFFGPTEDALSLYAN